MIDNLQTLLHEDDDKTTVPLRIQLYDANKGYLQVETFCVDKQIKLTNEQYDYLQKAQEEDEFSFFFEKKI